MTKLEASLFATLTSLLLASCQVGPDYVPPEIDAPDAWQQELTDGLFQGQADLSQWWKLLNDPVLDDLIDRAVAGNYDLRIAMSRIEEARAQFRIATGRELPNLNAFGVGQRLKISGNNPVIPPILSMDDTSLFSTGFDASWEVDLWGRVSRTVESAGAAYEASIEDQRDVQVTLFAEVARSYVALRTVQAELDIVRENVEVQQGSLELARSRRQVGLAPELDVALAETNLASTEAVIPPLQKAVILLINRLSTLVGEQPGALREELAETRPIPVPPEQIIVSIPANLLRQRPDIRGAERRLASQTARIGIATAELYPQLSLNGAIGFTSDQVGEWFTSASRFWTVGGVFRWNLFNGGQVQGQIDVEDARMAQALAIYEQTVLLALEEVESAMTSFVHTQSQLAALERAVDAAQRASVQSVDLYTTGVRSFDSVLDSQRALLTLQDRATVVRGEVTEQLIRIYKALGGGWTPAPAEQAADEAGAAPDAPD